MIEYTGAQTQQDIEQILALQQQNLYIKITPEELAREGFVTVAHNYEVLWAMNQAYRHAIARADGRVVGYALVMLKDFRDRVPELVGLFANLDKLTYQNRSLSEIPYFVMGQICVDKTYRGQGVVPGMYRQMRTQMSPHFELVLTSIATRNPRSLRAHRKVGFQVIKHFKDELDEWDIVAWDWNTPTTSSPHPQNP